MFSFLKRMLDGGRSETELAERVVRQAQQMSADLGADLPLADLRPVLIPSSILSSDDWFGPYCYSAELPLSLTWAYLRPEHTMQYLSNDRAQQLTDNAIDWRSEARNALLQDSRARPWTFRRNPDDESKAAAAVLQDDLGVSRLLCNEQLSSMFPNGFRFFVPDRYCAFVLAEDAPSEIQRQVTDMVQQAYKNADVPMSREPFSHLLLKKFLLEAGELV